ncbi:zinc ribbon domain-containing protein [Desulfovibrio sp. OttesenSCG-928-C14]|nr:zinc ribbon domain-containing protein [Desulfovibrio sp. OttesenSCG-928-C14]
MPIYEYSCHKCGKVFEEIVFGDKTPPCPACGCAETGKLISRPTLHMPAPSRVGQTVSYPSGGGGGGCAGCSGGNCSSC